MNKFQSRKYTLTFYTLIAATILFAIPPLMTFWWMESPLILMDATQWGSIVSATLLFYNGSNVLEKKVTGESSEGEK